jgi:hypothetical protein
MAGIGGAPGGTDAARTKTGRTKSGTGHRLQGCYKVKIMMVVSGFLGPSVLDWFHWTEVAASSAFL